jgi:uncharacterized RDD family membrane protein YckC
VTRYVAPDRDVDLQGHYAGMVSRLLAWVIDAFVVSVVFALLLGLMTLAIEVVTGEQVTVADYGVLTVVSFALWSLIYFAVPWTMSGKTVGMTVLGIQVRRSDGSHLDGKHAVIRILALPLSFVLFGLGLIMGMFQRQHRCLHDLIAGTCVVYSWDARRARLRMLTREPDSDDVALEG